jgi:hypothetical protein
MAVILGQDGDFPTYFLMESQTFVPPRNGNVTIHVIGAGGSGASGANATEHGGSGGGYCRKDTLAVTTAGSFTVVVGAGGLGRIGAQSSVGLAGGNSTCAGTGLSATLTANGGGGGPKQNSTSNGGGTASNGDVNRTGGGTGRLGGGGAVGINADGQFAGAGNTTGADAFAGQCETLGDFWNGTRLGKIYGERRGYSGNTSSTGQGLNFGVVLDSGPLSGGAYAHANSNNSNTGNVVGGKGGNPGGGGGDAYLASQESRTYGGEGGGGMVIFSYKP